MWFLRVQFLVHSNLGRAQEKPRHRWLVDAGNACLITGSAELIQNSIQVLREKEDTSPYSIQKIYSEHQTSLRQSTCTDQQRQVFSTMHVASAWIELRFRIRKCKPWGIKALSRPAIADGVVCVRFCREMDGDNHNAPCFSPKGLLWLWKSICKLHFNFHPASVPS